MNAPTLPLEDQPINASKALVPTSAEPEPEFDWAADNSIMLKRQPAIAAYFNVRDELVIRQEALDYSEEDSFIYIAPDHVAAFLDKLCDICGIPSVGKP